MRLEILQQAVMDSRDGITISDNTRPDNPLIFVNPAFERMTGYLAEEIAQINCRYLQNQDRDQPAIKIIHDALAAGEYCLAVLRNYRKDGTMFWNELSISPIHDQTGVVTNFIGIQKDISARVTIEQQLRDNNQSLQSIRGKLEQLATLDGLTGIYNRRFFDVQMDIQWRIARRSKDPLTLIIVDIDYFKQFNDRYGHQAGDEAIKQVARCLNTSFSRASDFVARYGGEEFVVLATGMTVPQVGAFTQGLCQRVRELRIPHVDSPSGYLTISAGFSVRACEPEDVPSAILERADKALYQAKRLGRNQCVRA
jgi:diguanylate cyclase (GGDEF)-like protein/PAS domain S-box-containing protein